MKWQTRRPPKQSWVRRHMTFIDLISDDDEMLGWVLIDTRTDPPAYTPHLNYYDSDFNEAAEPSLAAAKKKLVAFFVLKHLEDA